MPKPPKPAAPNITIERIKQLMDETGLKNIDLAKETGVDKVTVSRWLNYACNPSSNNLERIADALCTTIEYLHGFCGAYKWKAEKDAAERLCQELYEADYLFTDETGKAVDIYDVDEENRIKEQQRRQRIRQAFFSNEFGYSYQEDGLKEEYTNVFCTLKDESGNEYCFDREAFEKLVSRIKDVVDLTCYRKRNEGHDCGGIKPAPFEKPKNEE